MTKDNETWRRWSDEAARWFRLTLAAAASSVAALGAAALLHPSAVVAVVFLGGVGTLAAMGHAALFSFLLFREQVRLLLRDGLLVMDAS